MNLLNYRHDQHQEKKINSTKYFSFINNYRRILSSMVLIGADPYQMRNMMGHLLPMTKLSRCLNSICICLNTIYRCSRLLYTHCNTVTVLWYWHLHKNCAVCWKFTAGIVVISHIVLLQKNKWIRFSEWIFLIKLQSWSKLPGTPLDEFTHVMLCLNYFNTSP